jgi:hypothetical protein
VIRRRTHGSLALIATIALTMTATATADAGVPRGVVPDLPTGTHLHHRPIARIANPIADLPYLGGPVMHSNRSHLIFWQPAGSGLGFDPGYIALMQQFLVRVAADSRKPSNVYGLSGQYSDSSGPAAYDSRYGGGVVATDPLPPRGCSEPLAPPLSTGPGWNACINDIQIQDEVTRTINANHLPTGPHEIYFLVTPDGLGSCSANGPNDCALGGSGATGRPVTGSYCGYHSATSDARILYAIIPFNGVPAHCQSDNPRPNSSPADPTISTLSHEHNEVVTDPLGTGWIDNQGNENGDLCATEFGRNLGGSSGVAAYNQVIFGGRYYTQDEWSNDDHSCQPRDEPNSVSFSAPRAVPGNRKVSFGAHARDADGRIVSYTWSFGDGRYGSRRQTSHTFRTSGTFAVTLRITDLSGNQAYATRAIRVSPPTAHRTRGTG